MKCTSQFFTGVIFKALILLSNTLLFAQPEGFTDQLYVGGFNGVVGLTFDENGTIYTWTKEGKVYVVQNGIKRPEPLIDISDEVGNWRDFGLLGFTLDPAYLTNGRIYLGYVVDRHHLLYHDTPSYDPDQDEYFNATISRITRYTVTNPSDLGSAVVDLSSRKVLIGDKIDNGIPVLHQSHGIGSLVFGTDGTLLVSTGDGASYIGFDTGGDEGGTYVNQALIDGIISSDQDIGAYRSQYIHSYNGKILRIDPESGEGLPSNPFYEGNTQAVASRVWALGFRNPFRMALRPNTGSHWPTSADPGVLYVGDVGFYAYEELNIVTEGGQNFGWPYYDGMNEFIWYVQRDVYNPDAPTPPGCQHPFYKFGELIQQLPENGGQPVFSDPCNPAATLNPNAYNLFVHKKPAYDWGRDDNSISRVSVGSKVYNVGNGPIPGPQFGGNCSIGGTWYMGEEFPEEYRNTYFHADYGLEWIRNFGFDGEDNPLFVKDFDLSNGPVVAVASDPLNGGMYYIRYGTEIREFIYNPTGNQPPLAQAEADVYFGAGPLTVSFIGNKSSDPEGSPLSYIWDFGDGQTSPLPNPTHIFTPSGNDPQKYEVELTVTDNNALVNKTTLIISVNNTPPVIESTSLDNIDLYSMEAPSDILLEAIVTDEEYPDEALTYKWQTVLYHNNHNHPEPFVFESSILTRLDPVGCDGETYWYRISLVVTDPGGLEATYEKDIYPNCNAPQAIDDATTYQNGLSTLIEVLANDQSVETLDPSTVTVVGNPDHGTTTVDPQTGLITYQHSGDGSLNDQFSYTVTDVLGRVSNQAFVTLSLVGPPEVILTAPSAGEQIGCNTLTVSYETTGDRSDVDRVHIILDNQPHITLEVLEGSYTFENVSQGPHTVTVQLVDETFNPLPNPEATVSTDVTMIPTGGGSGLLGIYFDEPQLEVPIYSQVDPLIQFDWGVDPPSSDLSENNFAIQWLGDIQACYTETYEVFLTTGEGVRLWLDNKLIIDEWSNNQLNTFSIPFNFIAGATVPIEIKFRKQEGQTQLRLEWESARQPREVVPTSALFPSAANPLNQVPTTRITASPLAGEAPLHVNFDASNSIDPDGGILTYSWDWGDGNTASGATTHHTYAQAGIYTVTLTATDENGSSSQSHVRVVVGMENRCEPEDVVALYDFQESQGMTVYDVSGRGAATDLIISNPAHADWLTEGGLVLNSATSLSAGTAATKITEALKGQNSFSFELWLTSDPANQSATETSRILSLSGGPVNLNFMIGQEGKQYVVRLRTTQANSAENGLPQLEMQPGSVSNGLQHLVITYDQLGDLKGYLNGVLTFTENRPGNLSNWDEAYTLTLANEVLGSRPWLGTLYKVAIYEQALTADEIDKKWLQGYDCVALPCELSVAVTTSQPQTCEEMGNAQVILENASDNAKYSVINQQTKADVSDLLLSLPPGNYQVFAEDGTCRDSAIFVISQPDTCSQSTLTGSYTLQGRQDHAATLTLTLYDPANDFAEIGQYTVTGDEEGSFILTNIPEGVYEIGLKHPTCLQQIRKVVIITGNNVYDWGELRIGDVNNDDWINILDFTFLLAAYNAFEGMDAYDPNIDFNGSGVINILDFSLMLNNYNQQGDKPGVDNNRLANSVNNFSRMPVQLQMRSTPKRVLQGEQFTLLIDLDSHKQPIDGVELHYTFDPEVIRIDQIDWIDSTATVLMEEWDTNAGTLDWAMGYMKESRYGYLKLARVTFTAIKAGNPNIAYSSQTHHQSMATYAGQVVPMHLGIPQLQVEPLASASRYSVNIFPNPSKGEVQLQIAHSNAMETEAQVALFDAKGSYVKAYQFTFQGEETAKLHIPSSGLYILRIICGSEVFYRKVMVSK